MTDWHLFSGQGEQKQNTKDLFNKLKEPPPWREFGDENLIPDNDQTRWIRLRELAENDKRGLKKGKSFRFSADETEVIDAVNAAIYLRRPLLVTGNPGSGKSSLAYAIAYELNLGSVLSWAINARSTLQEGLYRYDAIARLQDTKDNAPESEQQPIGKYIKLGALGTAFLPSHTPRVLLIDEIDKSDINLPNDLLNLFEEGKFEIPELVRRSKTEEEEFEVQTQDPDPNLDVKIKGGWVNCTSFPIVVMTSNGEREFPPAFKRRCLRVKMPDPQKNTLKTIVKAHFGDKKFKQKEPIIEELINDFLDNKMNEINEKATDQLLNAIYIFTHNNILINENLSEPEQEKQKQKRKKIRDLIMKPLNQSES